MKTFPPPGLLCVEDGKGVLFTRQSYRDWGGFPPGWRAIRYRDELAAWVIVRGRYWPVARARFVVRVLGWSVVAFFVGGARAFREQLRSARVL